MQSLITCLFTMASTAFGVVLTVIVQNISKHPELCFELAGGMRTLTFKTNGDADLVAPAFQIEIFNTGNAPAMLNSTLRIDFADENGKYQLVADVQLNADERVIMPYERKIHELEEQDFEAMMYHSKKSGVNVFDITIDQMGKKKPIKGKIDVTIIPGDSSYRE